MQNATDEHSLEDAWTVTYRVGHQGRMFGMARVGPGHCCYIIGPIRFLP